jgi:hydroxymethylpyrimidine pyrophosphatase-like HAD family hydrolase/hypoxanthine phosphoribosyltransferase
MQTLKFPPAANPLTASFSEASVAAAKPLAIGPHREEANFFNQYAWALNAFPTIREVLTHLVEELNRLGSIDEGWRKREISTNIFLLACSVTDTIDDYLAGTTYDFSKLGRAFPPAARPVRILNRIFAAAGRAREARWSRLRTWSEHWRSAVTGFLRSAMVGDAEREELLQHRAKLTGLLPPRFPESLWQARPKMPAFFRSRDFAPADCLELGKKFVERFPDGERPAMVMGLRTAGSFLAPLLCAYLGSRLPAVDWIAIRPKKGLASSEQRALREAAGRHARVLIIDESIHSGQTLTTAIELLRKAGFRDHDIVVLNPAEPAFPDWKDSHVVKSLCKVHTITLEPAERSKQRFLDSGLVESLFDEYFRSNGCSNVQVVSVAEVERINSEWRRVPERVDVRLKRLYEVHLRDAAGEDRICRVLAKSVGCGWLSYHAFQVGQALSGFVPPVLGLREGILYTEWLPPEQNAAAAVPSRKLLIETLASYVAARTRELKLDNNLTTDLVREGRHKGLEMLAGALSRAYSSRVAAAAERFRIQEKLSQSTLSVLTDSKMAPAEWLSFNSKIKKTDYEHHAQGKNELGMTDPAYDLADAVLQFDLSGAEERQLIDEYVAGSGDVDVKERLFLNKVLAGLWSQNLATLGLQNRRLSQRRHAFHEQYTRAWNFLVSQTVRECGRLCTRSDNVNWCSPLVALDIDGVLDRMVFGFPSTTAAGIRALSLFASHGFTVAFNTARTLREVKEYCASYGLPGGVAEYGAIVWDQVNNRQVNLVDAESMRQIGEAQRALAKIPGVFLNKDYQCSLRAFTYQNGTTMPLPRLIAEDLLAELELERLQAHHTGLDTAITARGSDKGKGLLALLSLTGIAPAQVTAVGDSEPDLAMFRVAGRSFAPGNVSCRKEAELLGCHIANSGYQPGLLEIARAVVHPGGGSCDQCRAMESTWQNSTRLVFSLLQAADERPLPLLLRHFLDPSLLRVFRK